MNSIVLEIEAKANELTILDVDRPMPWESTRDAHWAMLANKIRIVLDRIEDAIADHDLTKEERQKLHHINVSLALHVAGTNNDLAQHWAAIVSLTLSVAESEEHVHYDYR